VCSLFPLYLSLLTELVERDREGIESRVEQSKEGATRTEYIERQSTEQQSRSAEQISRERERERDRERERERERVSEWVLRER
jgi:hypothetical protein